MYTYVLDLRFYQQLIVKAYHVFLMIFDFHLTLYDICIFFMPHI